jgi:epi-isozizaene synthase
MECAGKHPGVRPAQGKGAGVGRGLRGNFVAAFSNGTSQTTRAAPTARAGVSVPGALRLQAIETEFPRHRHAHWPELQRSARSWLLEKRLMPADLVAQYADALCYTDLVAGYYVGAPDEVVSAIADFSTWFFVWDDKHDRDAVHGRVASWQTLRVRLHAALDDPESHLHHEDPLVAAFAECVVRLFSHLGPRWNGRFAGHFHAVIEAYDQEFSNRRTGTVPTVDAYIELRRHTFAHWVWLDLLELAADHELPESIRNCPEYRRAALASQDFSAWYNDLCSLPKEIAGDEVHNLGVSLIHHEGLTLEEAVTELRHRTSTRIGEFLEAERHVLRMADEAADGSEEGAALGDGLRACLFNMRNWFSSVYWFHHESGRYRVDTWDDRSTPPYISDPAGDE